MKKRYTNFIWTAKCLLLLLFLTNLNLSAKAQILAWDFSGGTGSETTVTAGTINTNITAGAISRGAGITAIALGNAFSSTGFTASGTLADAKTNNKYLQFTIKAKTGFALSLSTLDFNFRRSSTGPNAFQWQYSLDGFATAGIDVGSAISYTLTTTNGDAQTQISLTGISALQSVADTKTVTFRLYGYGASAAGGTFAFGRPTTPANDLAVGGSLAVSGTPDTTPPTATTYSPTNGSTSANLNLVPKLTFSENVQKGTGNIIINNINDQAGVVIPVTSTLVDITNNILSINAPNNFFVNGKTYAIQIGAGAIKDLATTPNDFAGILDNTTWTFSFNVNPTVVNDVFTVNKNETFNGNVATNDSDPNSLALTYSLVNGPVSGTLTFNTDGTFSYIPANNYIGTQTFSYKATNSNANEATATVTLNVAERSAVIISQYYEGTGVNKWIELTNLSNTAINTASPQLQLALYNISGDVGNITYTNASTPSQKMNLNVTIPARGTVIIGNSGNSGEITYVTPSQVAQNDNNVINFNGNDGIALLDGSNQIIDAFGQGVNAKDISYVRNQNVTGASSNFVLSEWTVIPIADVQAADDTNNPIRFGVHIPIVYSACVAPSAAATNLVFSNVNFTSLTGTFTTATATDEYVIIGSTQSTLGANPVNGTTYNAGDIVGNGSVVSRTNTNTFSATGLNYGTNYYYYIYSVNSVCTGGPIYQTTNVLSGNQTTNTPPACSAPLLQPTNFTIDRFGNNFIQGSFTASAADEFLVIMSTNNSLSATPTNGVVYMVNQPFGGGIVVKRGIDGTFTRTGLTASTPYYFFIYSLNSTCTGGPVYQIVNPLMGNQTTTTPNSGTFNYYYGNLHAHSSSSDGNKDDLSKGPTDDYAFAKGSMFMDFLGISEHNHTGAGMSLSKWQPGIDAAKTATANNFAALYGMEWGTISGGGHVVVYGIDSLIGWEPSQYQIYVAKGDYTGINGLFKIVNRHGLNAIAYLAHPNTSDYNGMVSNYSTIANQAVIGSAVESGPAFSTNVGLGDPGSRMSYLGYFNQMLAKGYHIAPTIDHDNHNLTFGRTAKSRLVILANSLTENDLLNSMKARRFYATEDYTIQVSFKINNQLMGSIMTDRNAPVLTVDVQNATTNVTSIQLLYGVPGSGAIPTIITSSTNNTLSYTDSNLSNLTTGYYYADITEFDGTRTITAPIWYTRNDAAPLPITLVSFDAKLSGKQVNINWITSTEINNDYFTVERSADGINFERLTQVKGAGNSNLLKNYFFADENPFTGVNYYRIRQTDFDGKSTNSIIKAVNVLNGAAKGFNIYPNPAQREIHLALNSNANDLVLKVISVDGRIVYQSKGNITQLNSQINQVMGNWKAGVYILDLNNQSEAYQAKLLKQ